MSTQRIGAIVIKPIEAVIEEESRFLHVLPAQDALAPFPVPIEKNTLDDLEGRRYQITVLLRKHLRLGAEMPIPANVPGMLQGLLDELREVEQLIAAVRARIAAIPSSSS